MRAAGLLLPAIAVALLVAVPALAAPPAGNFSNRECTGCHARRDATLVGAWRASTHARAEPKADCVACHGGTHDGAAARARRDQTCVGCHEKLDRATVHSYATSKHGTIVKLEASHWDWSRPLQRGYRAPGCAYCHMQGGEHDTGRSVTSWDPYRSTIGTPPDDTVSAQRAMCGQCHAPRYVLEQSETGARMVEIARMKLREAHALAARGRDALAPDDRRTLDTLLAQMQTHARNVRLGVGHQSPDYQWWHGHPALDGDLLRIKGVLGDARRPHDQAAPPAP
jgi:hypothetical protein